MDKDREVSRLIFCTDGVFPYAIGGIEQHSMLLIEALARSGKVNIIVIHPHKVQIFDKRLNIREISIQGIDKSKIYLIECYLYSKRVYSVLEKYPDYIIFSQGLSVWYKIKSVTSRLIIQPHGLDCYQSIAVKDFLLGLPFRIIFNYLFKHSARVILYGEKSKDILKTNIKDISKIVLIPYAINMPEEPSFPKQFKNDSKNLKVLFIGRFVRVKGINVLLKAARQLNAEGYADKITYYLGGEGPLYKYFTNNFKYKNINYLRFVIGEQLADLYKSSDLFVLSSFAEGMPAVVLEAMSYRLPIIVTNVGETSQMVDSSNGYLIEKNNIDALRKAIVDFYNLPLEQKNRLSENSYNKVKKYFTWKDVLCRYIDLFRDLAR